MFLFDTDTLSQVMKPNLSSNLLNRLAAAPHEQPFTSSITGGDLVYGRLRADPERAGKPVAEPDLRMGAVTLANNLTVVTGNVRHFTRIPGLRVENWL